MLQQDPVTHVMKNCKHGIQKHEGIYTVVQKNMSKHSGNYAKALVMQALLQPSVLL
jgi:hypothetical protein